MDEARRRLRERGLPTSPLYIHAEFERMILEEQRRLARLDGDPRPPGPMPRAEPDQVVRSAVRDDEGRILGRYAGAITAGMVDKQDVNAPTNEGSTWQMDLMDMSTRGGATGFGFLAVDVNSRFLYGKLVRDKTLPGLIAAFSLLL